MDLSSWFKVWEAISAVYAMCTRHQKVGGFRGLGQWLFWLGGLALKLIADDGS